MLGKTLLAVVVLFCICAAEGGFRPDKLVPNPKKDPEACGLGKAPAPHWVCNKDGIITERASVRINEKLTNLWQRKVPCGTTEQGYQFAVVLTKKVPASFGMSIGDAARSLHDSWGVGDAECNNGIVFLLARDDRQWYVSTGAGAKDTLTDEEITAIMEEVKPLMRSNEYDKALESAVDQMITALHEGPQHPTKWSRWSEEAGAWVGMLLVGAFFLFWIVSAFGFCCCSIVDVIRKKQYERRKRKFDEARKRTEKGHPIPATDCAICLTPLSDSPPQVLRCRHSFHQDCIRDWLLVNNTCPICRANDPLNDEADDQPAPKEAAGERVEERQQHVYLYPDILYDYQMMRLNRRFTTVVNPSTSWSSTFGRPFQGWSSPGSSSGSGGSGWGGGSSFGGGGAGGSW